MTGKLITLPARVWLQSARLLTRAAGGVVVRAASLAGQTIEAVTPGTRRADPVGATPREHRDPSAPPPPEPSPPEPSRPDPPRPQAATPEPPRPDPPRPQAATLEPTRPDPTGPEPARPEPARPEPTTPEPVAPPPTAPVAEEPVHVSEEPELVREVAEPGAEDGAGADITVMEPWSGYRHMNAREVITRASRGSRAELAAVRLYESRHRSRQTVLDAVDRQLKLGNGTDPA